MADEITTSWRDGFFLSHYEKSLKCLAMPNYKPVMVLDQSLLGKNFKIKWQSSKNKEAGYRALHPAHVSCSMKAWRVEKSKRGTMLVT